MTTGIVQNITGSKSSIGYGDVGTYIIPIKQLLNKILASNGYTMLSINNEYDLNMEKAVMEFQTRFSLSKTGMIDDDTYTAIINIANETMSNIIEDENESSDSNAETVTVNPHYDSFFSINNTKDSRINRKDIVITIGNGITKTIKDVFMRSSGIEVDTSGNPIVETYEFVAKDVIESDESKDLTKYTIEDIEPPASDIKYIYNFGKTKNA